MSSWSQDYNCWTAYENGKQVVTGLDYNTKPTVSASESPYKDYILTPGVNVEATNPDKFRMSQGDNVVASILPIFDDHAVVSSDISAEVNKVAVQGFVPQDSATAMKLNTAAGTAQRFSNLPVWDLNKWISRSFKIGQFTWSTGMPSGTIRRFIFPDLISEHSNQMTFQVLRRHFRNFFKGNFTIFFNSTNMYSGLARFSLIYESCGNPTDDELDAMTDSAPSIEIAANEPGTYELEADAAWKNREWNVSLIKDGNNSRQLYIVMKIISPLNVGEGSSTTLEIPIFMKLRDLMVAGLTAPLHIYPSFTFPKVNLLTYGQGNAVNKPVQWIGDAMNAGAGLVGSVFQAGANITKPANELLNGLKPIIGAAGDVMSGGAGLLGGFGDIGQMNYSGNQIRGLYQGRAVTDRTFDAGHVPTNTSSHFNELGNLSVIVDNVQWSTSDRVGDALVLTALCPTFFNSKPTQILNRVARTCARARGDMKLVVRAVKNKFQTGRLMIYLKPAPDPNCLATDGDNTNYSTYPLDLSNNESVEILIPYNGPKVTKEVSPIALAAGSDSTFSWGDLVVEVLVELKSNSAESTSCPLVFELSFCDTFELLEPSNILVEGENYIVTSNSLIAMRKAYNAYRRGVHGNFKDLLEAQMDGRFEASVGVDPSGSTPIGADLQSPMDIPIAADVEPITSLVSVLSKPKPIAIIVVQPNTMDCLTFYPHPKLNLLMDDGSHVEYERTNELVNCYTHWNGGFNLDIVTTTTFSQMAMAAFGVLPFDTVLDALPEVERVTYNAGDIVVPTPNPVPFPHIPDRIQFTFAPQDVWAETGSALYTSSRSIDNLPFGCWYENTPFNNNGMSIRLAVTQTGSSQVAFAATESDLTTSNTTNISRNMYYYPGIHPRIFYPTSWVVITNRSGLYDLSTGNTFWLNVTVEVATSTTNIDNGPSGFVIDLGDFFQMYVENIRVISTGLLLEGYAWKSGDATGELLPTPVDAVTPQFIQAIGDTNRVKAGTLYDTWTSLIMAQEIDLHQKRVEQNLNRLSNMRIALPFRSSDEAKDIPFNPGEELLYSTGYTLPQHQLYIANFSDEPIHVTMNISVEDKFRMFGFRGCRRPPVTTAVELGSSLMSPFVKINEYITSSIVVSAFKNLPKAFKKKYPITEILKNIRGIEGSPQDDARVWKEMLARATDHTGQMDCQMGATVPLWNRCTHPVILSNPAYVMLTQDKEIFRVKFREAMKEIDVPSYGGEYIDHVLHFPFVMAESVWKDLENLRDIAQYERRYRGKLIKFYGTMGIMMNSFNIFSSEKFSEQAFIDELMIGKHHVISQDMWTEMIRSCELENAQIDFDYKNKFDFDCSVAKEGITLGLIEEHVQGFLLKRIGIDKMYHRCRNVIREKRSKWTDDECDQFVRRYFSVLARKSFFSEEEEKLICKMVEQMEKLVFTEGDVVRMCTPRLAKEILERVNREGEMFSWRKAPITEAEKKEDSMSMMQGFREAAQACSTFNKISEKLKKSATFSYLSGLVDDPAATLMDSETARFLTARMAEVTHYMLAEKQNKTTLIYSAIYHTLIDLGVNYKSVYELAMKLVSYSSEETSTAEGLEGQMGVHSTILLPLMAVGFGAAMNKSIPSFADSEKCLKYIQTRASTFNQVVRMSDNLGGIGVDIYNKYLSIIEYWYGTNNKDILRARKLETELPNLANWLTIVGSMQEEMEIHAGIRDLKKKELIDKLCSNGMAYEIMLTEKSFPPTLSRLVFDNMKKLRKIRDGIFSGRRGDLDRYSPFVIELFGDTEVGKSFTLKKLINDTGRYLNIDRYNLSYTRSFDTDHWDGFHNQFFTEIDDFGQNTDDEEYKEFIVMCSPTRRILPMASLAEKGCPFDSPCIALSTNHPWAKPKTVYLYKAVWRRINMLVKAEFIGSHDAAGRPVYKEDMSHVQYQLYHPTEPNRKLGKPMSYAKLRSMFICTMLNYLKDQREAQAKHDMALLREYPTPCGKYNHLGELISGEEILEIESINLLNMSVEEMREYIRKNAIGQMMAEEDVFEHNFREIPLEPHALPTEFDPLQIRFGVCEWQHTDFMEAAYCLQCNPITPSYDSIYLKEEAQRLHQIGGHQIRGMFFPDRICWRVMCCYETEDVEKRKKDWTQLVKEFPTLAELNEHEVGTLFARGKIYGTKSIVTKCIDAVKGWISGIIDKIVDFVTNHPLLSIIGGMLMIFGTCYVAMKTYKKIQSRETSTERVAESKAYNQRTEPRVRGVVRAGARGECGVCRVTEKVKRYISNKIPWKEVKEDLKEIDEDFSHPICSAIRGKLSKLYSKEEVVAAVEAVRLTRQTPETEGQTLVLSSCPRVGFARQCIESGLSKLSNEQKALLWAFIRNPCDVECVCKNRMPTSSDFDLEAKELAFGFSKGEAFVDNSLQDMVPIAKRNLMRWHVISDSYRYQQNVFAVCGRLAVTNSHFVANIFPDDLIECYMTNGQKVEFRWRDDMWLNREECLQKQFDCAFVRLPVTVNAFRDLRHQFIKDADLSRVEYQKGYMLTRTLEGDVERRDLEKYVYDTGSEYAIVGTRRGPNRYRTIKGLLYNTDTQRGDCGSILMLNNPNVPRKLIGFHCHGSPVLKINGGQLVTQEMIQPFTEQQGTMMAEILVPPNILHHDQDIKPMVQIPAGTNLEYIGIASNNYQVRIPNKTALMPSPIHGVFPPKKGPAVLNIRDPRFEWLGNPTPLQRGINGWAQTILPFYERHLDRVLPVMRRRQLFYLDSYKLPRSILSVEDAINGFPWSHEMSQPIDMTTSPGLPFVKDRPPGERGKKWLFEEFYDELRPEYVLYRPGSILQAAIDERLACYRQGLKPLTVWYDMLKDELRTMEKIKTGNTRTFVIGPVDYTIVFRQYFYHYVLALREARHTLSSKVGINPMGEEWTHLAKKLEGKNIITGDYSKFDRTQRPECIVQFAHNANAFYNDGEENAKIRLFLIDEAFHRLTVCGNVVYVVNQGIPSGFCVTSDNNGSDGEINMGHSFLDILEDMCVGNGFIPLTNNEDRVYTMCDFYDGVELGTYGDDAIMGVDHDLDFFNFESIKHSLGKFNITFTPEDKSDATFVGSKTLDEVTFLKRGFKKHHEGYYLAPLDRETIEEEVNWVRSNENVPFLTTQVVDSAVRDAYHHGREYFQYFQDKVNDALIKSGIAPNLLTYEDLDMQWKADVGLPQYIGRRVNDVNENEEQGILVQGALTEVTCVVNPSSK